MEAARSGEPSAYVAPAPLAHRENPKRWKACLPWQPACCQPSPHEHWYRDPRIHPQPPLLQAGTIRN